MKQLLLSIIVALGLFYPNAGAMDFTSVDRLFTVNADYAKCKTELKSMLSKASSSQDKAEVLWRLARVQVMVGQNESNKESKRAIFAEGVEYASQAVAADSKNPNCYMWHCAAAGRECQTKSLGEQAATLPVMLDDLDNILNKLGRTNFSEAWQALGEIYYNHPFKSKDNAINFARQAVLSIPKGEARPCTYSFLAKMLYERGWSAEKRSNDAGRNAAKFGKGGNNIDKYSWLDGKLGADFKCPWGGKAYGEMSDKEEAIALLEYGQARFKATAEPGYIDKNDFKELTTLLSKFKK